MLYVMISGYSGGVAADGEKKTSVIMAEVTANVTKTNSVGWQKARKPLVHHYNCRQFFESSLQDLCSIESLWTGHLWW